jgi:hypothetical protein
MPWLSVSEGAKTCTLFSVFNGTSAAATPEALQSYLTFCQRSTGIPNDCHDMASPWSTRTAPRNSETQLIPDVLSLGSVGASRVNGRGRGSLPLTSDPGRGEPPATSPWFRHVSTPQQQLMTTPISPQAGSMHHYVSQKCGISAQRSNQTLIAC